MLAAGPEQTWRWRADSWDSREAGGVVGTTDSPAWPTLDCCWRLHTAAAPRPPCKSVTGAADRWELESVVSHGSKHLAELIRIFQKCFRIFPETKSWFSKVQLHSKDFQQKVKLFYIMHLNKNQSVTKSQPIKIKHSLNVHN